jgi:hypothetical protein
MKDKNITSTVIRQENEIRKLKRENILLTKDNERLRRELRIQEIQHREKLALTKSID